MQQEITQHIFAPAPINPDLIDNILHTVHISTWSLCTWDNHWKLEDITDQTTIWHPPPEIVRQIIYAVLEKWCEKPLTTSALFIVPQVIPAFWWSIS